MYYYYYKVLCLHILSKANEKLYYIKYFVISITAEMQKYGIYTCACIYAYAASIYIALSFLISMPCVWVKGGATLALLPNNRANGLASVPKNQNRPHVTTPTVTSVKSYVIYIFSTYEMMALSRRSSPSTLASP